jgi:hypothetical protein
MNILLVHTGSGTFTIDNIYDPKRSKISIIMDFSHVMKKIRNNISKVEKINTIYEQWTNIKIMENIIFNCIPTGIYIYMYTRIKKVFMGQFLVNWERICRNVP